MNQEKKILNLPKIITHLFRQGIGAKLISKSIKLAKQFGCTHCATVATAQASQYLFAKHGFQKLREIEFENFLDNDEPVYLGVHDKGKSAKLMLLDLQQP